MKTLSFLFRVRRAGFTLVELLVTVALLALVSGAIVAIMMGGFQVWERVESQGTRQQWLEVAFSQLRNDLHRVRPFTPIGFKGAYDEVSFPTVIGMELQTEHGLMPYSELAQVGYYFDRHHKSLCRAQHPYRVLRRRRLKDACDPVLTDVEYVRFSYYTFDPLSERYRWSGSWASAEPPLAVKIEVRFARQSTQRPQTQSLVVHVPLGVASKEHAS